jgi:hypothetical protein
VGEERCLRDPCSELVGDFFVVFESFLSGEEQLAHVSLAFHFHFHFHFHRFKAGIQGCKATRYSIAAAWRNMCCCFRQGHLSQGFDHCPQQKVVDSNSFSRGTFVHESEASCCNIIYVISHPSLLNSISLTSILHGTH